jgi:hypothetical protein
MARKVTITISKKGKAKVEYSGYAGDACHVEASRLKEILSSYGVGNTGESVQNKDEYITDDPMQLNKQFN